MASGWIPPSPATRNIGHGFAADAAAWSKHLQDPKANPLPGRRDRTGFTDEQRFALVEYLKVHRDPPTPEGFTPPQCELFGKSL